jgi:hypothetical protein
MGPGTETRTNEAGEWTLNDVAIGTRMLEVRAVGYYPDRRPIDVVADVARVRVALSTLKSVLDTVRVTAERMTDPRRSGFEERRRSGAGRYLSVQDIAKRNAASTIDLLRMQSGIRISYASDTLESDMVTLTDPDVQRSADKRVLMRGISGDWCAASIYLNGVYVANLDAEDIDGFAPPRNLTGIEIYSATSLPSQYRSGRNGCGSVVIWTK